MRARQLKLLALALALAAVLPLAGDAAIPVPAASKAACCNVADAIPPPTPYGDEDFFNIPGGVPNIMLLLDSSLSMLGLPQELTYPTTWPASRGTCTGHWLNAHTPLTALGTPDTTRAPFDNGYNNDGATYETIDDPPWGLRRCQAKQARPAGDAAIDYCLFRPDSYYKAVGSASTGGGWGNSVARVYNANPCAAIPSNDSAPRTNYDGTPVLAENLAECQSCLATAGFYVMNPRRRTTATSYESPNSNYNQVVFAGWFLNGYPPKYVAARKVVKDLVRMDATPRPTTDIVRFGLTGFNPGSNRTTSNSSTGTATSSFGYYGSLRTAYDGGKLVVPLGPNCDQSFPISRPAFAMARQAVLDAVNATTTTTDWSNTRYVGFDAYTPLAESLFNIGQYFSNAGSSSLYTSLFTSTWTHSGFWETAGGAIGASWTGTGQNQHSFCWACQQSSVVVVTDGAPNSDSNLPRSPTATASHSTFSNDFRRWSNTTIDCATCGNDLCSSSCGTTIPNALHKVAYFLAQTDLRPDLLNGARPQNVSTYTISFGINEATDPAPVALLRKTALLGNGIFANTSSAEELADALSVAVSDVVSRSTSFSSANANSLQTSKTTSADAYLGRFRPTNAPMWEGHLFAAQIFDEFGEGCDERFGTAGQATFACGTDPAKNPNIDGDETAAGRAICRSSYVIDRDCDPIVEDASGNFKKAHFDPVTHALQSDPDDANLHWDAGRALSDPTAAGYRSASPTATNARRIYTVIDVNANGRFDGPPASEQVEFLPDNAAALAPLMDLPAVAQTAASLPASPKWCNTWLNQIGVCGASPLPSCGASVAAVQAKCAEHVINFYRGYDVMDWDADHCAGPGNYYNGANGWGSCTSNSQCGTEATCNTTIGKCVNNNCPASGEERDRVRDSRAPASQEFWKLGDVFHSSPVLVKAPVDKIRCSFGRENQCVPTIYSYQGQSATTATPLASYGTRDAYDEWRRQRLNRQQFVVVGANDGMLHAFDAGVADTSRSPDAEGKYPYTNGTGEELWAFIPPDLLPRLKDGLENHLYSVDGNTMVRDVWVDSNANGTKEATEFRTVAILSERGGGSRVTALDITDPAAPAFLWTFPEPCSEDSKLIGQTWSDFLPRPPPVGPVRLAVAPSSSRDPRGRGYEERWVVMLNGGYDAGLVRGRAVWTLDVWTGRPLWRFTDTAFKAMRGDANASMFPVAASIAMVDIGAASQATGNPDTDGYFDTATWGDLGGNLFTARFHEPGTVNATTGLVTNWHAARAFETNRQAGNRQPAAGRTGFYYMTANVLDGPSRLLSLLGTGDREHLLKQDPTCGPDNLMGCCASGCTVASATGATTYGAGSCSMGGAFQCSGGYLTYTPAATAGCGTPSSTHACGTFDGQVTVTFDCGAAGSTVPSLTSRLTCGADGVCTTAVPFSRNASVSLAALDPTPPQYRFLGVWSYGRSAFKRFATSAEAQAFDGERFTDVAYSGCHATPSGTCKLVETSPARTADVGAGLTVTCRDGSTACSATSEDAGWMYSYGRWCPMESCSPATWTDEKSSGGALIALGCSTWSSFRPTGASSNNDPCTASAGNPTSLGYRADARSGVPRKSCGIEDTTPGLSYYLAQQKNAFAPPQNASMRIVVNERGQVNYSTLKIETGSPAEKESLGTRQSVSEPLYWLEVPRVLHTCRHVDPTTCE